MTTFNLFSKIGFRIFIIALGVRLLLLLLYDWITPIDLGQLANWYDGTSYLAISKSFPIPYDPPEMISNAKHYPLYPLLIYLINQAFGNPVASAYFISLVAGSLSVYIFYLLARDHINHAFFISAIFCVFPPKWLSVSTLVWSEPVFVLFLLVAMLKVHQGQLLQAFVCFGLANIARPIGLFFLFSCVCYLLYMRYTPLKKIIWYSIVSLAPFLLFHIFLYFRFDQSLLLAHAGASGGWGGSVIAFPLQGLASGLLDPSIIWPRKVFTLGMFVVYSVFFVLAIRDFRKNPLVSLWIVPYFLFTLCLKGAIVNWWMISFPRFMVPLAPAGLLLIEPYIPRKFHRPVAGVAIAVGIAYCVGVVFIRSHYQRII